MIKDNNPKFFYGYVVVMAAFSIGAIVFGAGATFGVFFRPLLDEFGWTRAMTSGAISLHSVVLGIFSILMGWLTDKLGPRLIVSVGGLLVGLGFLLMSQLTSLWQLYLFYGLVAIGTAGNIVPLLSTVARWFVKRRGLMTGIYLASVGLGIIIMPPLVTQLISNYGWRTSYIILGIGVLIISIGAAQFLRHNPAQMGLLPYGAEQVNERESNLEAEGFSAGRAFHTGQFWLFCVMNFFFINNVHIIETHVVIHATGLGISAMSAAYILAFIGGANATARIVMGTVGDRIGRKPCFIIGFVLMTVALFMLVVARELSLLYLIAALFGFGWGTASVQISPTIAELYGLSSHGAILGAVLSAGMILGAIGPMAAGYIFDITSSYQLAFLMSSLMSIVGLVLVLFLKPIGGKGGTNESGRSA